MPKETIAQWLKEKCKGEHLSPRQAAAKTGLSHTTIYNVIKGDRPLPETIMKLAQGFTTDLSERVDLEDYLMLLAGYRSERPLIKPSNPMLKSCINYWETTLSHHKFLMSPDVQTLIEHTVKYLEELQEIKNHA